MKIATQTLLYLVLGWNLHGRGSEPLQQGQRYEGIDKVSAAVALDDNRFVTASTQDNVLRIYEKNGSAQRVSCLDVTRFLGADGKAADIRGAARIGSTLYWIGSHSRDPAGRLQSNRHCFFATTLTEGSDKPLLEPVGRPCTTLLDKLPGKNIVSTLRLDKAMGPRDDLTGRQQTQLAPTRSGLRIEALGADSRTGILFIAFRNPRPVRVITGKPNALVIPLNNPIDVVVRGKEPIFGEAMLWDFDGLGVTGLQYSPIHGTYFVLAQPHDRGTPCVVYRWSGMKAHAPKRMGQIEGAAGVLSIGPWIDMDKVSMLVEQTTSTLATGFQTVWMNVDQQ